MINTHDITMHELYNLFNKLARDDDSRYVWYNPATCQIFSCKLDNKKEFVWKYDLKNCIEIGIIVSRNSLQDIADIIYKCIMDDCHTEVDHRGRIFNHGYLIDCVD